MTLLKVIKVIKAILDGSFGKPPPEPLPDKTMDVKSRGTTHR